MPIPDRDLAINYLRFWYNASDVSKFVSANYLSFPAFIARVDTGTFLTELGSAMASIRQDKVKAAFEKLAADNPAGIPPKGDFFNYLAASVGNFTTGDAAKAAGGALLDVGEAGLAAGGLLVGGYSLYLILGGLLIILPMLQRAKAGSKGLL